MNKEDNRIEVFAAIKDEAGRWVAYPIGPGADQEMRIEKFENEIEHRQIGEKFVGRICVEDEDGVTRFCDTENLQDFKDTVKRSISTDINERTDYEKFLYEGEPIFKKDKEKDEEKDYLQNEMCISDRSR